ncbi:MAG TPA: restriction endonuclease [Candidatus Altiarchaeales archaeon]|nr:restriction endonuclease [Candidatus Altiarchaeales archaeon]
MDYDTIPAGVNSTGLEKAVKLFLQRLDFDVVGAEKLQDASIDFICQTTNPVGGSVISLIRASPYTRPVTDEDVKDLYEKMLEREAVRCAYITTSQFSAEAQDFAKVKPISLIDKYKIMESVESRGLTKDAELMSALQSMGFGEKHFEGKDQSFLSGKTKSLVEAYFRARASKTFTGKKLEKPVLITKRFAPVGVFKLTKTKDVWTSEEHLRHVEKIENVFINLHDLDLYYTLAKRKKNTVEYTFENTPILRTITELSEEPQKLLFNLLDHGDLPLEAVGKESIDLNILKNRKVIQVTEGDDGPKDWVGYMESMIDGILDTVMMLVDEITTGIATMGEGSSTKDEKEEPPAKKIKAHVNLPDTLGGEYNIIQYLETVEGRDPHIPVDAINHSSMDVAKLLKTVFQAKVEPLGVIFMPYYRCRYHKEGSKKFTKFEVLINPRFKGAKVEEKGLIPPAPRGGKRQKKPRIRSSGKSGKPFTLIKE